jgi:hypothetical protein
MRKNVSRAVALSLVLGFLAITFWQELVHELIFLPVSYLAWLGDLVYRSFDQQALWAAMLIVLLMLALISLRLKPSLTHPMTKPAPEPPQRVRRWVKRLDEAQRGTYMQWRLAQHIYALVLDSLAYRSGLSPEQVEGNFDAYTDDLPAEISAYLRAARGFETSSSMSRRLFSASIPQPLDLPPENILAFLEEYLELE